MNVVTQMTEIGTSSMTPLDEIALSRLAGVSLLMADLDDTISTHGKLTADAFTALWKIREAGLRMAIVTGRPAGWCDHIARFWPVDAVIGENGAFYFYHDGKKLRQRFLQSSEERRRSRERLNALQDSILKAVPGTAVASDQEYRESDLAIDFCEDVPPLERSEVLRIKTLFEQAGARAKISSIHVNGWFGDFDKLTMVKRWASEQLGLNLEQEREQCGFCGDSPNDEPMFDFFPLSFGMANLVPFASMLSKRPAFICDHECGAGFCQVVEKILEARRVAPTA